MIRSALWYAQRGFAIAPVAQSKAPLTPHGFKDATDDPAQIRRWWRAHPHANIAAVCSSFFVVDCDPRSGGEHVLAGWRRVRGDFPRTWLARTGSGGTHTFFRHDAALDAVPLGKLYAGLDIKGGSRGYVLLAPSVNARGKYTWIVSPRDVPLAKAPRWLIDEIVRAKTPLPGASEPVDLSKFMGIDRVERARRYARQIPGAVAGQGGDDATFIAANKIARGFALSEEEALAVMLAEFNPRCDPPWDRERLRRNVRRALDIGDMPIGELLEKGRAA